MIGVILLFFVLLALTKLKFRLAYQDGIVATAQVLFVKLRLYPRKKKRLKEKDFRIKRFRRRVKKNIRKSEEKAERDRLKAEKKKERKKKKAAEAASEPKKKRDVKALARLLIRLLKAFMSKFPRYLQTTVSRLVIGVASDDAANTAVTYGYVVQSVQYMLTFVEENSNLKESRNAVISVYPDFTSESSKIEIDLTFSIRIWQLVALGITIVMAYLKKDKKTKHS